MNFKITECEKYNILTIIDSQTNSSNSIDLEAELSMLANKNKSLICDFSKTNFIDATNLNSLLIGNKLFNERKNVLICCNVSEEMNNLKKLDNVLMIIESLDESIDFILFDELEKSL